MKRSSYYLGAFWSVMICLTSVSNDLLMKILGSRLPIIEIIFFRFFFSLVSILIFIRFKKIHFISFINIKTNNKFYHFLRILFGVLAIGLSCYSVTILPLADNTIIMFTQPLFFLPLASIFLNEKVSYERCIATFVGFLGVFIIIQPKGLNFFELLSIVPAISSFLFAFLDILTKKMVNNESFISMILYFSLGTTLFSIFPLPFIWIQPNITEYLLLFLLGIGANLIQLFLFYALISTEASSLAPFRYIEFIFSLVFGSLIFHELPTYKSIFGSILIIFGTFYISYIEINKKNINYN